MGKPEYVVNFMRFIAEELREYMAKLGVRTVDELVGRSDLLLAKDEVSDGLANTLDISRIIDSSFAGEKMIYNKKNTYNFELEKTVDEKIY